MKRRKERKPIENSVKNRRGKSYFIPFFSRLTFGEGLTSLSSRDQFFAAIYHSLPLSLSPCYSSGFESRVKLDNSESKFCQKITFTGKEFESELNCAQDNQHKRNDEYNLSRSVFNTHSEIIFPWFPACHPLSCLSLTDLFVKLNQGINSKNRFDCSGISSLRHTARFAPMFNCLGISKLEKELNQRSISWGKSSRKKRNKISFPSYYSS